MVIHIILILYLKHIDLDIIWRNDINLIIIYTMLRIMTIILMLSSMFIPWHSFFAR